MLYFFGAKVVVIKCGIKGYYIKTQLKEALMEMHKYTGKDIENWMDRELIIETSDVKNIKSTCAGGSSIAGF